MPKPNQPKQQRQQVLANQIQSRAGHASAIAGMLGQQGILRTIGVLEYWAAQTMGSPHQRIPLKLICARLGRS